MIAGRVSSAEASVAVPNWARTIAIASPSAGRSAHGTVNSRDPLEQQREADRDCKQPGGRDEPAEEEIHSR